MEKSHSPYESHLFVFPQVWFLNDINLSGNDCSFLIYPHSFKTILLLISGKLVHVKKYDYHSKAWLDSVNENYPI